MFESLRQIPDEVLDDLLDKEELDKEDTLYDALDRLFENW